MSDQRSKEGGFKWALQTGDLTSVKDFIEKQGCPVDEADATVQQRQPIVYAADYGQVEIVKYLISKGANVNSKDKFGITPLLAATYEGHFEVVKYLVSVGADLKAKGPDGTTAKEAAEKSEIKAFLKKAKQVKK
mmetsp:Transcript_4122/g.4534  ORF Transcript_4122/g.4534 Transcript_4122/m.4534 type:complete len:134 (-) Transcript_4122:53-454(-)|eukprot:CAMPEP_0168518392 /NCGR_PEP_ID=MMETSP0405-20121227/6684_1 /TAXON_ID=498012 /ORGANISM="Trichosphaerium sp, Strain Am-I-7 wt" /LENGTH=133 /DNA_ID=CAMNT_0008538713 /DNA_START=23 /DNA_END=424 /DNA_ORIENTATION=+